LKRWTVVCLLFAGALACDSQKPSPTPDPTKPADSKATTTAPAADSSPAPTAPANDTAPSSGPSTSPSADQSGKRIAGTAPSQPASAPTGTGSAPPPPEPTAAPVASGTAATKGEYSAWLQGPKKVKAGDSVTLSAVFTASGKYHCNEKYPASFKPAAAPAGVAFASDKFKSAAFGEKRSTIPVSLSTSSAGSKTVSGTMKFGVCDEKECIVGTANVSFTFEVE
jgi:hypothetical protein